jgi:hypothetical protein
MLQTSATATASSSTFDEHVLRYLRVAHLKAKLIENRLSYAGVALRKGWVTAEDALAIVDEAGLLPFVLGSSS